MILHISEEISYKTLDLLTNSINAIKENQILEIYLTCPEGGIVDVAGAFIDLVNKNKERIKLIFYGEIFSSGMLIFLKTNCSKELLPDTRGMFHFSWQSMYITEGGKPSSPYDIFSMGEMKKSKIKTLEYLRTTKLSVKEINNIKKGKDVFFSHERLIELI